MHDGGMSDEVLFDACCGEPLAWTRVAEPVIANEWTEHGRRAVTEWLSSADAIRNYGPITEVVLGLNRGFKSVTYGDKKFVSRRVDPRGSGLYDDSVVVIHDPVRDDHECPVCGVAPGEQCIDEKKQPRSSHRKRRQGLSRWEIARAEAAAAKQRVESLAAEEWARKTAIAPAPGEVVEVENRKFEGLHWVPIDPDRHSFCTPTETEWQGASRRRQRCVSSAQRLHRRVVPGLRTADLHASAVQELPVPHTTQGRPATAERRAAWRPASRP